jgi:hypothetical protein
MGAWYWIGVAAGLGAAVGVLLAGFVRAPLAAIIAAASIGLGIGFALKAGEPGSFGDLAAGVVGGAAGALGAAVIVSGALKRGGTRGGTAFIVAGVAVAIAALAFVPVVGYLEALALPLLAARLRRREPERYAGLRSLARD